MCVYMVGRVCLGRTESTDKAILCSATGGVARDRWQLYELGVLFCRCHLVAQIKCARISLKQKERSYRITAAGQRSGRKEAGEFNSKLELSRWLHGCLHFGLCERIQRPIAFDGICALVQRLQADAIAQLVRAAGNK